MSYNAPMYTISETKYFREWLQKLRDKTAQVRIIARIRNVAAGNLGDTKPVGPRVFEMRIHTGPGYRVYYTISGDRIVLLLLGGDKSSQQADIERAIRMARQLKEQTP